ILLIAVVQFYRFAFMFSIWCWLQAIVCLCQLKFVRGTIWFCLACGMLFWWMGTDIDFDTWLHGSATIVGLAVIATLLRYLNRILPPRKNSCQPVSASGFGPKPPTNDKQVVVFSLHAKGEVSALAVVTRSRPKPQQRLSLSYSHAYLYFGCQPAAPSGMRSKKCQTLQKSSPGENGASDIRTIPPFWRRNAETPGIQPPS